MIKNYFKTTLRHLWRNRLFTALNMLGLAIGISACWMIYRIVDHEFSYDAKLPNKENIYQVISAFSSDDKMGGVGAPLYQGIRAEIPGLEQVVPVFYQWVNSAEIKRDGNEIFVKEDPQKVIATDVSYFNMLPYTWLAGDKATALNAPGNVVLTQSRAKEYFPGANPEHIVGQTIQYYGRDTVRRTVTGVVADYDMPSEFTAQEFFALREQTYEMYMWTNTNGSDKLFLQLKPETDVEATLQLINELDARHWKAFAEERGSELQRGKTYELLPVNDIHFATGVSDYFGVPKTSKPVLYGLVGIGAFLLILACINYINMSVAQIPVRAKEIGVRKTLGGGRSHLIAQFLSETAVTAFIASILAFAFSRLGFVVLDDIIPAGATPYGGVLLFFVFTLGVVLFITVCAGLYPSWLIARVKTVVVLKNSKLSALPGRFSLQKVLIVFQFFIALVFITCTIIVGAQLRHTLKADMGFNKDAIVLVSVPWKYLSDPRYRDKQFTLLGELRNIPGVENAALGTIPLAPGGSFAPFQYDAAGEHMVERKWIDSAYLGLYGMELLAGRNIRQTDTVSEYIINESAARLFGFATPQDAIGQPFAQRGNSQHAIVGVVKDFHTLDFYTPIGPLALMSEKSQLYTFNIKLNGRSPGQWQATLNAVAEQWSSFYPAHSFQYRFYDEALQALYQQERQIAKLINLATAIAIFVSCLGLFGLATLTAFQRTKEIGIRKVLGASVASIVRLFSLDYVKLIAIALVIASPLAWWAMSEWLEDFAYRIDIAWWMFALAGLSAIVIALLTVSWQVIRAALANPVDALRDE